MARVGSHGFGWEAHPEQVSTTSFKSEQEMEAWCNGKWDACASPSHPPRLHLSNWLLHEKWYTFYKGKDEDKEACLEEKLERRGKDLASGVSALSLEDMKPKGKSMQEKYKIASTKVVMLLNKFNRALAAAETSLPPMKRQLPMDAYAKRKSGVMACRSMKDSIMDELEDLKQCPDEPILLEEQMGRLEVMQKELVEHLDALQEAMGKVAVPKKEQAVDDEVAPSPGCTP